MGFIQLKSKVLDLLIILLLLLVNHVHIILLHGLHIALVIGLLFLEICYCLLEILDFLFEEGLAFVGFALALDQFTLKIAR